MTPFTIPAEAAQAFLEDMRAFHAETDGFKRSEIAARQRHILSELMPGRGKKLRLSEVKSLFNLMHRFKLEENDSG